MPKYGFKPKIPAKLRDRRGVILIMVLGTLLIVVILSEVVLNIIRSQGELTYHQVSRLEAYYSALAGMNLAADKLRLGSWASGTYRLCDSGCTGADDINDINITHNVTITVGDEGSGLGGQGRTINLAVTY